MYVCKYHILADENTRGFALMSKSIGKSYVDKMSDFHKNNLDRAFYPMNDKKLRLPRYFKNKLYDKSELDKLARLRTKDMIDIKDYEKFKKKYPKSNYFKVFWIKNYQLSVHLNVSLILIKNYETFRNY